MIRLFLAAGVLAAVTTPAAADQSAEQKERRIRQMTEVMFQNYPPRALAAGEQGAVFFIVKLDDKGSPTSCEVTHSSGHPLLDEETCLMIVRHGVFKQVDGPDGKLKRSTHEGVVNWTLPGHAPAPIKPIQVTESTKPEKQICKRTVRIGTLAGYERTCMTEAEWKRATKETQDFWEELQGKKGSTNGKD